MGKKALVVIDIQNDITKNYRSIIGRLNEAIDRAAADGTEVVYIKHNNLSEGTRTFKPGTRGSEFVPELHIVSGNVFVKSKASALTSEGFAAFIRENGFDEFYIAGADATGCIKSACFNMRKAGYAVRVISDCVTSYDLSKMDEMLAYYAEKGCEVRTLAEYIGDAEAAAKISIRPLEEEETEAALELAWRVFTEFESPVYAPEGTAEFRKSINDENYLAGIRYYGAFDAGKLIGVLGVRNEQAHICFFFVDGEYQRRGTGTGLFKRMLEDFPGRDITLNAAPYGLPFYKALGFNATDDEQTVNGIRFTPMEYKSQDEDDEKRDRA